MPPTHQGKHWLLHGCMFFADYYSHFAIYTDVTRGASLVHFSTQPVSLNCNPIQTSRPILSLQRNTLQDVSSSKLCTNFVFLNEDLYQVHRNLIV